MEARKNLEARQLSIYEGQPWSLYPSQHELKNPASDYSPILMSVWFLTLSVRFTLCVWVFCFHVCLCTTGQKRVSDTLVAGNWSPGHLQDHYWPLNCQALSPRLRSSLHHSSPHPHLLWHLQRHGINPSTIPLQLLYTVLMQQAKYLIFVGM